MALMKSMAGNNIYTWKSDDIRDAEIKAITEVYSSKNLLPMNLLTTHEVAGMTITVNQNNTFTVAGVCNATYGVNLGTLYIRSDSILTGCPIQTTPDTKYYLDLTDFNGHTVADTGNGAKINYSPNIENSLFYGRLMINIGADFSTPKTFYPMVRDARITDPTFVPFALTNAELTKRINTYDVLWTGDLHTKNDEITLAHGISNYNKIMFVFNVIPSRSPDFDVPGDQEWYPAIQTFQNWNVSSYHANIKDFTIKRLSDTTLQLIEYIKSNSSVYNEGLVKVIGFKTM